MFLCCLYCIFSRHGDVAAAAAFYIFHTHKHFWIQQKQTNTKYRVQHSYCWSVQQLNISWSLHHIWYMRICMFMQCCACIKNFFFVFHPSAKQSFKRTKFSQFVFRYFCSTILCLDNINGIFANAFNIHNGKSQSDVKFYFCVLFQNIFLNFVWSKAVYKCQLVSCSNCL